METEEIVKVVVDELRDRGLIKENQRSAYSSAELLLYNYPNLQKSIHENNLEIEELRKFGLPKKSSSCVSTEHIMGGVREDDPVILEERISRLTQSNARTQAVIQKVNRLIQEFDNPKYPDLIKNLYFDGKTREECAEIYSCDVATISRNKSKIINGIKTILFPNETVNELGY